ncbi:MAG: ORF6N domain-containing protein, partial [Pseudomonadota bacterium]|nr:ORF6N domain-containing protein [Pseudomonadota bacterium]
LISEKIFLLRGKRIMLDRDLSMLYDVETKALKQAVKRNIEVNIQIMRTFTNLRNMLATHDELREKIEAMEDKYDHQFKVVFDAIKQIIVGKEKTKKRLVSWSKAHWPESGLTCTIWENNNKRLVLFVAVAADDQQNTQVIAKIFFCRGGKLWGIL